jgi:hypothetical protein
MSRFRLIGTASTPKEIADALNIRRQEMNLTLIEMNEALGFATNYLSKLVAPGYKKHLGTESLPALLTATGCRLAIIHDEEAPLPPIILRALADRTGSAATSRRRPRAIA